MGTLTTERLQTLRVQLMAGELARQVGARIRARREELGLNQRELAERVDGQTVTNQRVSDWERGVNQPSQRYLQRLADALEVEVGYFYERERPAETPDAIGALKPNGALPTEQVELLLRIEALLTATLQTCLPNLDFEKLEAKVQADVEETLADRLRRRRTG
jgi:transcriptional regulator with XRE-family HTH domain